MSRYFDTTVRERLGVHGSPKRTQPSRAKVSAAMHEVFSDKPSTVKPASPAKERKQMIAIAFSKARKGK